jgi:protein-S-isoprenylcysteine O-methyltransferase Ste14
MGSQGNGRPAWWVGARGEWYVIAQIALFAVVAFGPRNAPGVPRCPPWLAPWVSRAGVALLAAGSLALLAALLNLGRNLTPLPYPKDDATFVATGAYRWVRHPIYASAIAMAFGWSLCVRGPLTLVYVVVLFGFFDLKSRREERWLVAKFSDYADYQRRVRRLIPFVY